MNSVVNITIIVFTEQLIRDFINPSKDPLNPTEIPNSYIYFVKSGQSSEAIRGFSGKSINIRSSKSIAVEVNFFTFSETSNYDNPVILYQINQLTASAISSKSLNLKFFSNVKTIVPESFNPLTCQYVEKDFWYCSDLFVGQETREYALNIALYDGNELSIVGYFQFNQTLSVS